MLTLDFQMFFKCFAFSFHDWHENQDLSKVGVLRASHKIFLSLTGKFE
jgi:hypothetical protein